MDRSHLPAVKSLRLDPAHMAGMQSHVHACLPLEACGLLAGSAGVVEAVLPVRNAAASPVRFRMDPIEQLRALDWIESQGLELVGIFHSHPAGPDTPSATDVAEAAYAVVYIIWSYAQGNWKADGYWIYDGRFSAVQLYVADGESGSTRSA